MNAFNNHTAVLTNSLTADLVISNLVAELTTSETIINVMRHYMPAHQMQHVGIELFARGVTNKSALRAPERKSVIALAKSFQSAPPSMRPASEDLVRRLRYVAGQSVIKAPALDLEAADHIEKLEREIALLLNPHRGQLKSLPTFQSARKERE